MTQAIHKSADQAMVSGDIDGAVALLEGLVKADRTDFSAWMKLASIRRRARDPRSALDAANAALDSQPNHFLALLLKGSLHQELREEARAAEVYRAAIFHAEGQTGLPPQIARQLSAAQAFLDEYKARVSARMPVTMSLDPLHQRRAERLMEYALDRRPVFRQEPTHYRYPDLPDIEYFDFAYEALRQRLIAAFPDIKAEFVALMEAHADEQRPYVDFAAGQPTGQWEELNRSPKWNALHLLRYGERDPVNAPACPKTLAAFAGDEQADIPGLAPNLMFSLLAPQTRIPPHHGVANFRAVLHLPIIVPGRCGFRVGADTRFWQEGQPWIFDDTIEHEAWNESDELRVVLIGDLWRPELDPTDRMIVRQFMSAQDGAENLGAL